MVSREAVIAAQRFGFGATPDQLVAIDANPRGWLHGQLGATSPLPDALADQPSTLDDQLAFFRWLGTYGREARKAKDGMTPQPVEKSYVKALYPRYRTAVKARFDAAVATPAPFRERLVHFWSNHFVVSGAKPVAIALPPSYERDAIRPYVTGRFQDMLLAVAKHPAMLTYLDNARSIGPNSERAKHPPRRRNANPLFTAPRGLNENLAREILELHTVGADAPYTQADVTSFAKVLTGWQPISPRQFARFAARLTGIGSDLFYFDDEAHEPGTRTVMGKSYAAGGVEQGEAVLRDLARDPNTAQHIATKLARHFVADEPSRTLVERLAAVFTSTDGDLGAVTRALVDAPEPWQDVRPKLKQPEEFLISAVRSFGGPPLNATQLMVSLNEMGQRPWMSPGPDGWSDQEDFWLSPDGVWKRLEWADVAGHALAGRIAEPTEYMSTLFGPTLSDTTRTTLARAESPAQSLALALTAPEFMRR